jgi:hypothetical protein
LSSNPYFRAKSHGFVHLGTSECFGTHRPSGALNPVGAALGHRCAQQSYERLPLAVASTQLVNASRFMPFKTTIKRQPGYVQVEVAGPNGIKDFVDLIATVGQETLYWSDRKVIVDLREVVGELTSTEQVFLGELVAQDLAHIQRLASIVAPGQLTRNSENAAQERGAPLRVFDSESDAVAWITADTVQPADVPRSVA